MGQYWQVINLDKKQTFGFWGKLGEFLFDGTPTGVALYLVPVDSNSDGTDNFYGVKAGNVWAGDRIICIGDYSRAEDSPEGMLTTREFDELTELGEGEGEDFVPMNLCSFAASYFNKVPYLDCYVPPQTGQVLRNLSKRVYVRDDALEPLRIQALNLRVPFGLGEVLLAHIVVVR